MHASRLEVRELPGFTACFALSGVVYATVLYRQSLTLPLLLEALSLPLHYPNNWPRALILYNMMRTSLIA